MGLGGKCSRYSPIFKNVQMNKFEKMGLRPEVLRALKELNFNMPTAIQEKSIPVILNASQDLIGFAQTGTGKTAAFSLPIIEMVEGCSSHVQALILCPTRELCMQITRDIKKFSKYIPNIKVLAIYGGDSAYKQLKNLQNGAHIVVGTPGRVKDFIKRGKLKLGQVKYLVLDEADDMLDKGFKEDLSAILDVTPEKKQTLLFSATMSPWIEKIARQKMKDPIEIKVANKNQGSDNVSHQFLIVNSRDRYAALRRLLDVNPDVYGIVFCRTRKDTKEVAGKLIAHGYPAEAIHGDVEQSDRSKTMNRFRKREIQILVATDVAARGIDVNQLTHVINYELPDNPETYVHRSGRTGRAGCSGVSLTIINMKERRRIQNIERMMRKRFKEIDPPTGNEICEAQLMNLIHKVKNTKIDMNKLKPYLPAIYEELHGMNIGELIQHFVSVEFNRFLNHYSNIDDMSTKGRKQSIALKRHKIRLKTYRINLGKKDGFSPKVLFSIINKKSALRGIEIGSIQVQSKVTQFEADANFDAKLKKNLRRENYKGRPIMLKPL